MNEKIITPLHLIISILIVGLIITAINFADYQKPTASHFQIDNLDCVEIVTSHNSYLKCKEVE